MGKGLDADSGHGVSRVVDESRMVMMNHRCDLNDDVQGNASLENPLASVPNQHGTLRKEDDQF